eukprot:RCo041336
MAPLRFPPSPGTLGLTSPSSHLVAVARACLWVGVFLLCANAYLSSLLSTASLAAAQGSALSSSPSLPAAPATPATPAASVPLSPSKVQLIPEHFSAPTLAHEVGLLPRPRPSPTGPATPRSLAPLASKPPTSR